MRIIKDNRRIDYFRTVKSEEGYNERIAQLKALLAAGENIVNPERLAAAIVQDALATVRM